MFSIFLAIFVSGMLLGIIVIRKPALFVSQIVFGLLHTIKSYLKQYDLKSIGCKCISELC